MSTTTDTIDLRWDRAAAWARQQSLGPHGQSVNCAEVEQIEALRDRIVKIGENAAFDEWNAAYMSAAVAEALPGHEHELDCVLQAAEQLWDALADLGVVDDFGGGECRRVLPDALAFIRVEAN